MTKYFVTRYFYPDESSGNALLLSLTKELIKLNLKDISVLTSNRVSNSRVKLKKFEIKDGIKIIRLRALTSNKGNIYFRAMEYGLFLISVFVFILLKLKKEDTLISMSDPPMLSAITGLACYLKGINQVQWVQDVYPEITRIIGIKIPFYESLIKFRNWSMRKAHLNVVISEEMKKYFIGQNIDTIKLLVIPNWTSEHKIYPIPKKDNESYKDFGDGNKFKIGYSGNFGILHDFTLLLRAANKIKNEDGIEFIFIGSGYRQNEIKDYLASNALENIKIYPFQPESNLNNILNIPDIHVITLKKGVSPFAYPSKIYGAMAAGKPILFIGERDSEIYEFVQENNIGFSIPNNDLDQLIRVILKIYKDKNLRSLMSKNARDIFIKHYSLSVALRKWSDIFFNK